MQGKQQNFFRKQDKAYGGELLKTSKGRSQARPLATKLTMHLVLRSSKAKGPWSFKNKHNEQKLKSLITKFTKKYHVKIISLANVGNHLHFHIKLAKRQYYRPFIRALTAAIAIALVGNRRWTKGKKIKFWDYRPFTRVISGLRDFLNMRDYLQVNQLEGLSIPRRIAQFIIKSKLLDDT